MSFWAGVITTFASCFTAAMVFMGWLAQMKIISAQRRVNMQQDEINLLLHARIANLERQVLPEADLEGPHVH